MQIGITMFATDYAIAPHELAIEAEARGFESLWFPEHSHIPTSRATPYPAGAVTTTTGARPASASDCATISGASSLLPGPVTTRIAMFVM